MEKAGVSIRQITVGLIVVLAAIIAVATVSGLAVLQKNYQTAESRFELDARTTLNHGSITIRNQLQIFNNILELIATDPGVVQLVEFGDAESMQSWAMDVSRMLPGNLGTALAHPDGALLGDARLLRVGNLCRHDLQRFGQGEPLNLPLVHHEIEGMEHFDLLVRVRDTAGENLGVLFASFRLQLLQQLLDQIVVPGQRYILEDAGGYRLAANPPLGIDSEVRRFEASIPDTDWTLRLELPPDNALSFYASVIMTDIIAIVAVGLLIFYLSHRLLDLYQSDIKRIHRALLDVHNGVFSPTKAPPAIRETAQLLPDIEALAQQLQERNHQLEHQSVTDPLTGVHNRRYFDLMLQHAYEQSARGSCAYLAIIDLNDFKLVNDRCGHTVGDGVLSRVAGYLHAQIRASDTLARLGGDEFAMLLNNMSNDSIRAFSSDLATEFDRWFHADSPEMNCPVRCSMSIGIAAVDASHFASAKEVLVAADRAMYGAKQAKGRNSHVEFAFR